MKLSIWGINPRQLSKKIANEFTTHSINKALGVLQHELQAIIPITRVNLICHSVNDDKYFTLGTSAEGQERVPENIATKLEGKFKGLWKIYSGGTFHDYSIHSLSHNMLLLEDTDNPLIKHRSVLRVHVFRQDALLYYLLFFGDEEKLFKEKETVDWFFEFTQGAMKDALRSSLIFMTIIETQKEKVELLLRSCPSLHPLLAQIDCIVKTNTTILITGETGTGKELVAQYIHDASTRNQGPFVKVNCGALPESLLGSLFFGHEKGAFTGAFSTNLGYFEQAQGGTILLDELGELSLTSQAYLLRVLDNREIQRVGSSRRIPLDIRILASTNKDIAEMVRAKTFRADLWYRLNEFPLFIPPLRDRQQDIEPLVQYFLKKSSNELQIKNVPMTKKADIQALWRYTWPGNIRELEHIVKRAVIQCPKERLHPTAKFILDEVQNNHSSAEEKLNPSFIPKTLSDLFDTYCANNPIPTMEELKQSYIAWSLIKTQNKVYGPASSSELLQVHPHTVKKAIQKLEQTQKLKIQK